MPARARKIAGWAGGVLLVLLLIAGAALLSINTGPGRAFLVRQLAGFETASGLNFRVGRIDGSIYGRMVLHDLEVRDPEGAFLTAPLVTVDWRPFSYLRNKIEVHLLDAPAMVLKRLPALRPVPSDPNAPLLPDIDIAVRRLAVARMLIEPAVDGRTHILRIAGAADIADRRARVSGDIAALAGGGVAGGDRLTLKLDAVPDANRLQLEGRLQAPVGGLVDSYAKLGRPLAAEVGGTGDWANWRGMLRADAGGQGIVRLSLLGRNGRFDLSGWTRPGILLTGPAARLTEPQIAIRGQATLGERLLDSKLSMRSQAMTADAEGRIDFARSRFGNLRLAVRLLTPGAIAANLRARDLTLQAVVDGPFATPSVSYQLAAAALGFGDSIAEGVAASGAARIDADRILIPVHATARAVTGLNAAAGGLLTHLAIDGDLAWSGGRLLSDNLRLRSDRIDATAIAVADIGKGRYTGALKGRVNDYQVDGIGRVNLVTNAELVTGPRGGFGIRGWVRANTARLDNPGVRDFLGGNALVTANVGLDENGVASISALRVTAPQFRISAGSGSYRPDGRIAFAAQASSTRYGALSLTVTGTAAKPLVKLRALNPGLGVGLRDVSAEVAGTGGGYAVRATGQSAYGPLSADLLVRAGGGPLRLDIHNARFAGIDFAGSIAQTAAGPFAGALTLAGSGLSGSVRLAAAGANQRADIDVRAADARVPGDVPITIQGGTIRATALLLPAGPSVTGEASLTGVRQGSFVLTRARARLAYQNGRGTLGLVADGSSGVPFSVAAQAALAPERIRVNLSGSVNGIPVRLAAPAEITQAGAGWQLQPATIVLPQGSLVVSGRTTPATQGQIRLNNVDLTVLQPFMAGLGIGGKANGTVDFAMPPGGGMPTARARIDINRFTRSSLASVSTPVDLALLATLSDAGGDLRALVRRGGGIVGRLQVRLAPLPAGGAWTDRLLRAPLGGGIRYNGPAELLWSLAGVADQQLSGQIAVAADFAGRADQPQLTGVVRANALRYENETYGTLLTGMAIEGRFTQSRLELTRLQAKAGSGTVSASGTIGLDAASGFPVDVQATLTNAQLARSDALGATVSGTLRVTNSRAGGALIRGDLRIPEARYQIIRQGAAEVAELEGVRRKGAPPPEATVRQASAAPSLWKLDIRVRADNRLYVSGMGLESEWRSDLRVTGTSRDPRVTGTLQVVRGTYSFAGRRFDLSRGEVRFEGGALTNPQIDIAANTTVEGVTATINITGSAQNPQIAFTSTPALPQDEVLSRLLFGASVTSLSPTQALQLAAALNSLRGSGGGGLNPLGKLRQATGIDRLRVLGADQATGRGTALAAGKYITNNIYVEVITDARGFTATQIEFAISKALSILSSTSSFGGSNVNLRYSKDY